MSNDMPSWLRGVLKVFLIAGVAFTFIGVVNAVVQVIWSMEFDPSPILKISWDSLTFLEIGVSLLFAAASIANTHNERCSTFWRVFLCVLIPIDLIVMLDWLRFFLSL